MRLLEPASPDSFFAWASSTRLSGPRSYCEAYIMAPTAERMLVEDEVPSRRPPPGGTAAAFLRSSPSAALTIR